MFLDQLTASIGIVLADPDIGVHNPTILADSLSRMHGRQA